MRRLSSASTFFNKTVFPAASFGGLALVAAVLIGTALAEGKVGPLVGLLPVGFLAVFGYFLMRVLVFDLVDEVWDNGHELIVRNDRQEERIPLAEIINISQPSFSNPPRVTITLRNASRFGSEITYCAPGMAPWLWKSTAISELIQRVDAHRRQAVVQGDGQE